MKHSFIKALKYTVKIKESHALKTLHGNDFANLCKTHIIINGRAREDVPEKLVPDKSALSYINSGDTFRRCYHDRFNIKSNHTFNLDNFKLLTWW